jgi:hypothetical protein
LILAAMLGPLPALVKIASAMVVFSEMSAHNERRPPPALTGTVCWFQLHANLDRENCEVGSERNVR